MILLDTNIIIYSKQAESEFHQEVTDKLIELAQDYTRLVICPQVIYEFYRVATSSAENNRGLGLTPQEAILEINNLTDTYELVNEHGTLNFWSDIMSGYNVRGKRSHDGRLVATMRANDINRIYTLNVGDFNGFNDIITLV